MRRLLPALLAVLLVGGVTLAQTSGQVQDEELADIRTRLDGLETAIGEIQQHEHDHDHIEFTNFLTELGALSERVDGLASGVPPADLTEVNERIDMVEEDVLFLEDDHEELRSSYAVNVENLRKRDAYHYQRLSLLESALDETGNIFKCWDTAGVPDRDLGICHCPPSTAWRDDSDPDDSVWDQGCYWDTGVPAGGEPEPPPDPDEDPLPSDPPPDGDLPPVDICEPVDPAPTNANGTPCVWSTASCAWECQ